MMAGTSSLALCWRRSQEEESPAACIVAAPSLHRRLCHPIFPVHSRPVLRLLPAAVALPCS